jgi:predicted DNA binding CopG/RHH family protein
VKRKRKAPPNFGSDRKAADFWATHDSARHASGLKEEPVTVDTALRRRVVERAAAKKAVTLRLENQQIARAKELARHKSVPYQTLMRMWIAEGLAKESSKTA